MTRMVTFEERVWTITAQPRVKGGARATAEHDVLSHMGGLWFLSDKGDKYFLPLKGGSCRATRSFIPFPWTVSLTS